MFNFAIVLNAAPFYVLAQNNNDLEEILKTYGEKVVTVISAEALQVMEFKLQMSLSAKQTLLIPVVMDENKDYLAKHLSDSEQEEMVNDLTIDIK